MAQSVKFNTAEAARFCTENGRRISVSALRKYRIKGAQDPGERGPRFMRDPSTGKALYLERDLLAWIDDLERRLVERGSAPQPRQLSAA
jgi:hypothetical protein